MKKGLQKFSTEYIKESKKLKPIESLTFLEELSELKYGIDSSRKLISIRIPVNLLNSFKTKAKLNGQPYQSIIVRLMREYLQNN